MPGDPTLFNKSVKKKEALRVETAARASEYLVAVMRCGHRAGTELWLQPWRPPVQICGLQLGLGCPQEPQKPGDQGARAASPCVSA